MHYRHDNRKGVNTIVHTPLLIVIVVGMTVIVYTWSLGIFGSILPPPPTGREILTIENQGFDNTNTNMTLYIRNTGSTPTTLASYYITDQNNNQYAQTNWPNNPINPTTLTKVYLLINTACPSCGHTGNSFTFQTGNSYTITLVTQRNNQFSFTIVR